MCVFRVCSKCGIFLAFSSVFVCLKAEALCFLLFSVYTPELIEEIMLGSLKNMLASISSEI